MTALAAAYGIDPKTGHKWVARFLEGGVPNLVDRSRAPHTQARALPDDVVERVLDLRRRHPTWGPKKLRAYLQAHAPALRCPAASTVGELLERHGLVRARPRRPRTPHPAPPPAAFTAPNVVWCADFKGWFRVGGRPCHPLTVSDGASRYLLCCQGFDRPGGEPVRRAFEATFRQYGLPLRLRTDNGAPFAANAVGGLSRLAVWWVKLGVLPERIEPGRPQQNGRHERMHRTLGAETARPPERSFEAQQQAFDRFRKEYNDERPHEALGQATPASAYAPSPRAMPRGELPDPLYPPEFEARRVHENGSIGWHYGSPVLGAVLGHELVGLEPVGDGRWQLWFGPVYLGLLLEKAKGKHQVLKNLPPPPPPPPASSGVGPM